MTGTNPLDKIKDVATGVLRAPAVVLRAAAGLLGKRPDAVPRDPEEPVNVTEELGLDPAPVAKPKRARKGPERPVTSIDAEADAKAVRATPADIADAVSPND